MTFLILFYWILNKRFSLTKMLFIFHKYSQISGQITRTVYSSEITLPGIPFFLRQMRIFRKSDVKSMIIMGRRCCQKSTR